MSYAECMALRLEADVAMRLGATTDFTITEETGIGEVHVSELPVSRWTLRHKLGSTLLPAVARCFGVRASSLRVYDALVLRYDAARDLTHQPTHRDAALLTLNIALSDEAEYEGGGTRFEASGQVIKTPMGHMCCHASGVRHAGRQITRGERWVLVVFLLAAGAPQPARRLAAAAALLRVQANEAREAGDTRAADEALDAASTVLATGLGSAPCDAELHHARGSLHLVRGERAAAKAAFWQASRLYSPNPAFRGALGSVLLGEGRVRGALRHFEAAAAVSGSCEDAVARAAAVEAARCAVELHEATPAASAHVCIDHAMDRLRAARDAEPAGGEEEAQRVEALLRRAERARDLAREGRP